MELIITNKPKEKTFYFGEYIKQRIKKHKNFLVVVCGETGSGKSLSAVRLAEIIDPNFNAGRIVFEPNKFLQLVKGSGLKAGSVIVLDESGVGMNNRNWFSAYNKIMNFILQTFRYKGIIVIFTLPDLSFLDSSARKLLHCYMRPKRIDFKRKRCILEVKLLQTDPTGRRKDRVYMKFPRPIIDGEVRKLKEIAIGLPTKTLLDKYEKKKRDYAEALYQKYSDEFLLLETGKVETKDPMDKLSDKQKVVLEMHNKGSTNKEIAKELDLNSESYVSIIKKQIIKKGIKLNTKEKIKKEVENGKELDKKIQKEIDEN